MDWHGVIERNGGALRRVLATLIALAGIAGTAGDDATMPRHLHRTIIRLLRPAEAAARRLIIILARDLVVRLAPARPGKPRPPLAALRRLGIAIVLPTDLAAATAARRPVRDRRPPALSLSLVDPPRRPFQPGRIAAAGAVPRVWGLGMADPAPVASPPAPDDPVDATRLGLRLAALGSALDDLPRHAMRFARWTARRDRARAAGRPRRMSPLRAGPAYGARQPGSRRHPQPIDDILADLHHFANLTLARRDTS